MKTVETIFEVGINANGSIDLAKQLIDVAATAGCDYVKFQKRTVEDVYTKEELDAPRESPWGKTNRDQKNGLEFGTKEYMEIDRYCKERGIRWFASPWDLKSVAFLASFNDCAFIKVPSALITLVPYLEACRDTGKPIILSTGMSTLDMVDEAVSVVGEKNIYCVMHCTSTYPSKPEELNLKCIETYRAHFSRDIKIGFSNHNSGIIYMPVAVSLGAEMVEFHGTLDRASYGSDQSASIEPEGVYRLVKYIRNLEKAMGDGKKVIYPSEVPIAKKLRR